jgi:hypothetical protein
MRRLAAGLVVLSAMTAPTAAQERDRSLERIGVALKQPAIAVPAFEPTPPQKLGPLTLVEPQLRGELVRVSLPVGEYVTKAIRGIAGANQRRKECAARRRVEADLKAFLARSKP